MLVQITREIDGVSRDITVDIEYKIDAYGVWIKEEAVDDEGCLWRLSEGEIDKAIDLALELYNEDDDFEEDDE